MYEISHRDFESILAFLQGAYTAHDSEALDNYELEAIPRLTPCLYVGVGGASIGKTAEARSNPAEFTTRRNAEIASAHLGELPEVIQYLRTSRSEFVRRSDCPTFAAFEQSTMYQEVYRSQRVVDACSLLIPTASNRLDFVGVTSDGLITDRDRNVLIAISPHLVELHRSALAVTRLKDELGDLRAANDRCSRAVVAVDPAGRILRLSDHGRLLLEHYFGTIKSAMLPGQVLAWMLQADAALRRATDLPAPNRPRVIERPGRRLIIRFLSDPDRHLVVVEEQITDMDAIALRALGLTRRQAEVLKYVALGKSNPEIGIILGLSPRTAGKHVEEILRRLHVSTRTEAASMALDATILQWNSGRG